jgi:hypothetical protein
MKRPKEPPRIQMHTIAYRVGWLGVKSTYCTTCGKLIGYADENKRCKGAKR